jgi:hypothetical protein
MDETGSHDYILSRMSCPSPTPIPTLFDVHYFREPEAALAYCASLSIFQPLHPSHNIIICDAGSVMVQTSSYKILGNLDDLEVAEACVSSHQNWYGCSPVYYVLGSKWYIISVVQSISIGDSTVF